MKMSSWLRFVPATFAVTAVIAFAILYAAIAQERSVYEEQRQMSSLGADLLETSDFLTEQARFYVQYGEQEYLLLYMEEADVLKNREKVMQSLIQMNAPKNEIALANQAAELSYELEKIELKAFDFATRGNLEEARKMMFDDRYKEQKQKIIDVINEFQKTINDRCQKEVNQVKKQADIALDFLGIADLIMVFITFLCFKNIKKKIAGIEEMISIANSISEGKFDLDFTEYDLEDEFEELADGFKNISGILSNIESETTLLVKEISEGNLVYRTDIKGVKGNWSKVLYGLNTIVQSIREQIIENAPIAYLVVKQDEITDCNRFAVDQIGMKRGEKFVNYFKNLSQQKYLLDKLKLEGRINKEQVTFKVQNGEFRRFLLCVNIIDSTEGTTLVIWGMDSEDEARKTDIIRRSQGNLQKLIDALPMAMVMQEPETKNIEYANAAFYRLMGFQKLPFEKVLNEKLLFSPEQSDGQEPLEKEEDLIKALEITQTASSEFTYRTRNRRNLDTRVTASEIVYNGKRCVVKMIQDIGEEKLRTRMLLNTAEREREANQLKSSFLANMSHEIRTPMNAIIGFTQIALTREQDEQNINIYRKINSSAKNLLNIINDILDFSKVEAQKMDLVEDNFFLEDIIANAFMVASERIEDKRIEMLFDIEPDLPLHLIGDKTRLWQVIKNLLDNSAKYTEKGNIILKVFKACQEGERIYITFRVTDTGIGMSEQQVASLFIPFSQFSDTYKYKTSGTGLGMAIVKQLIELMKGQIDIKSELNVGTEISITIGFTLPKEISTLQSVVSDSVGKCSVLIADDDPISCEIMQRMLTNVGFHSICVHNGRDAIDAVRNQEKKGSPFKVIILDFLLGDDNGIMVGKEIAEISSQSKLLMVSAYVKKIPENLIHEVGFKDVLQKPLMPSAFFKRICNTLDEKYVNPASGYETFKDAKILLCEDNPLNQEVAVEMLRLIGIEADVASNGKECIEKLETGSYDLVLMDILMPVMDGKEATKIIRSSGKPYKDVCILALTANVIIEQVNEFSQVGMNGYIPKPIEMEHLYEQLSKYLKRSGKQAEAFVSQDKLVSGLIIEGIKTEEGLARFGGQEKRYEKALLRFVNENNSIKLPDTGDEYKRYIHTLKGVCGNLGMMDLAKIVTQFEGTIKNGVIDMISYDKMSKELLKVCENIRKRILVEEEKSTVTETGDGQEYEELLKQLKETLLLFNPLESERILNKLTAKEWEFSEVNHYKVPDFALLKEAIDGYDFDKALHIIEGK